MEANTALELQNQPSKRDQVFSDAQDDSNQPALTTCLLNYYDARHHQLMGGAIYSGVPAFADVLAYPQRTSFLHRLIRSIIDDVPVASPSNNSMAPSYTVESLAQYLGIQAYTLHQLYCHNEFERVLHIDFSVGQQLLGIDMLQHPLLAEQYHLHADDMAQFRIHWPSIISDLLSQGYGLKKLAREFRLLEAELCLLFHDVYSKKPSPPHFFLGIELLRLHTKVCAHLYFSEGGN